MKASALSEVSHELSVCYAGNGAQAWRRRNYSYPESIYESIYAIFSLDTPIRPLYTKCTITNSTVGIVAEMRFAERGGVLSYGTHRLQGHPTDI